MRTGMPAPNDQPAADRFAILWTDYLEGELDPAGMQELNSLLAADDRLVTIAADLYQTHRRLGLLAASTAGGRFVADVMQRLPAAGTDLTRDVMGRIAGLAPKACRPPTSRDGRQQRGRRLLGRSIVVAAVAAGLAGLALFPQPPGGPPAQPENAARERRDVRNPDLATEEDGFTVRFASLARAKFLHRQTPARHSEAIHEETYVLSQGLVELAFPRGATAILEAPAAFRICSADCLAIDTGRCSIHAPPGAEGFRVETPATQVIDRGTRFFLEVDETNTTEVQMIEGEADLVAKNSEAKLVHRLMAGDVAQHDPAAADPKVRVQKTIATAKAYYHHLPDRLVRYTATLEHPVFLPEGANESPGIDTLASVTVQRDGRLYTYGTEALIGVKLLHVRVGSNANNLTSPGTAAFSAERFATEQSRRDLLETDHLLTTGVINPGGDKMPLTASPLLAGTGLGGKAATPGMAIAFVRPVVNAAGPDVVYFDLQILTDPETGDAFHIAPLQFAPGLRSLSITRYDIDSSSPESQLLAPFRLYTLAHRVTSLADLLACPMNRGNRLAVRARANAVGIDLSDLGYAEGATCDGLFFQDADDDNSIIDPVFIAGLPPPPEADAPMENAP
jgi:hypothetical protein